MTYIYSFGLGSTFLSRLHRLGYLLIAGSLVAAPASAIGACPAAPAIPGGTAISMRALDVIESRQAQVGQSYRCTWNHPS